MRILLCLILLLGAPLVPAHELNDSSIKIKSMTKVGKSFLVALIENTHASKKLIRCAFYDESNNVLAVEETLSEEFATELSVEWRGYFDPEDVKSYRCIYKNLIPSFR